MAFTTAAINIALDYKISQNYRGVSRDLCGSVPDPLSCNPIAKKKSNTSDSKSHTNDTVLFKIIFNLKHQMRNGDLRIALFFPLLNFLSTRSQANPFLTIDVFNMLIKWDDCFIAQQIFLNSEKQLSVEQLLNLTVPFYSLDLSRCDSAGHYPYHYARSMKAVKLLKELGADVNAVVGKINGTEGVNAGKTTLMTAMQRADADVVEYVHRESKTSDYALKNGANVYHIAAVYELTAPKVRVLFRDPHLDKLLMMRASFFDGKRFLNYWPIEIAIARDCLFLFNAFIMKMVSMKEMSPELLLEFYDSILTYKVFDLMPSYVEAEKRFASTVATEITSAANESYERTKIIPNAIGKLCASFLFRPGVYDFSNDSAPQLKTSEGIPVQEPLRP